MNPALFRLPPSEVLIRIEGQIAAREMHFHTNQGKPYYLVFRTTITHAYFGQIPIRLRHLKHLTKSPLSRW